jgi:RHS repeat-associated protein
MQTAVQEAAFGYEVTHHRLVQQDVVDSTQVSWSLRGDELVVTTVQAGTFVRELGRDAAGRVVRTRDELGFEHHYRYDALGRLVAAITPDGAQRLEFDGYGQPHRIVRDGLATITYGYSPVSGLPVSEDVAGSDGRFDHGTRTERDATGRALHVEQRRADGVVQDLWFDYDGVGAVSGDAIAPGQRGRLSRVRGQDFDRRTLFDTAGHLARQATRLAGGWREIIEEPHVFADGSPAGRRLTVRDGQGAILWQSDETVRLDSFGQLEAVVVDGVPLYTVHLDGEGRLEHADFVDGQVLTVARDPMTRRVTGYRLEGANLTVAASWNRDQRGLIADEKLTQRGTARTSTFGYDARGTLRNSTGDLGATSYDYTPSGLPTTVEDALGARNVRLVTAGTSTIGGVVHRWDALGRLVQRGAIVMSYGADGQVVSVRRALREATYAYDDAGQRLLKRVDGQPERAFVAGGVLTATSFTAPVRVEGILVGVLENGHFKPLAADVRGTPFVSAAGSFDAPSPYGVRPLRAGGDAVIDYAGMPYDADLGAVRMGVRDYDPYLGQFLTPDPLFLGSLDKCRESPIECGLFGYARANPLAFVDPDGKEAKTIGIDELVATFVKYADTFQVSNASVFLGLLAKDYGKDAIIRVEVSTQRADRCFEKPETKVFTMPVTAPKEGPAISAAPKGDPIRTPLSERVSADLSGLRASPLSSGLYMGGLARGMTREQLSVGIALGNNLWSMLDGVNSLRQNEHSAPDAADDRERIDRGQQK